MSLGVSTFMAKTVCDHGFHEIHVKKYAMEMVPYDNMTARIAAESSASESFQEHTLPRQISWCVPRAFSVHHDDMISKDNIQEYIIQNLEALHRPATSQRSPCTHVRRLSEIQSDAKGATSTESSYTTAQDKFDHLSLFNLKFACETYSKQKCDGNVWSVYWLSIYRCWSKITARVHAWLTFAMIGPHDVWN